MSTSLQTKLDVLNMALGLLGETSVNAFDPDLGIVPETTAGEKVAQFYEEVVDEVQQSYFWQELVKTADLTSILTDDYGRYYYDLDVANGLGDLIRPMGVIATSIDATPVVESQRLARLQRHPQDSNIRYTIARDRLYTIADGITLSYIGRVDDPSLWSPELGRSIYYNLAVTAAHSVTNDPNVINMLLQKYETLIRPTQEAMQTTFKSNDSNLNTRNGSLLNYRIPTQQSQ